MNWGNKILIGFSTFVLAIVAMVYIAMKQNNEMIDDNYYENELKYQDKIDASKNLSKLAEKISIKDSGNFLQLHFPLLSVNNNPVGTIECIRSSDQKKDVKMQLHTDKEGAQLLPKSLFMQGMYQLRVSWSNSGTSYFHQQALNIRP